MAVAASEGAGVGDTSAQFLVFSTFGQPSLSVFTHLHLLLFARLFSSPIPLHLFTVSMPEESFPFCPYYFIIITLFHLLLPPAQSDDYHTQLRL